MPLPSYRIPDLPTRGAEAWLPPPPPVVTPAILSSEGLVHVSGAPGTVLIPSPQPPTSRNVHPSADPNTQPGNVSPDAFPNAPLGVPPGVWKPAIYVASTDNMGPQRGALGISVRHHEDVPVPAINVTRIAKPVQRTPPYLGGKVTPWPRVFARFKSVLG